MSTPSRLEIWAGIEGTINRVGDLYHDQCSRNGHREREGDIEQFAKLGITRIRYPFLWETTAPDSENQLRDESRWKWMDLKVAELERAGLQPIAGLCHHGSGPRYTSLLDPEFPAKFARYAAAFARRYPQIEDYTPINEILTTARFSALYGVWYPHVRDQEAFLKAILNEVLATRAAMKEIRKVNPKARLIQTDDLGRCQATPPVQYQADFENVRRWLGWDLLCGRVNRHHEIYYYLRPLGLRESIWRDLEQDPCPPDLIGINHYPLSNRYLDHREELHPREFHGGNGVDRYADRGAVDVPGVVPPGPDEILMEAWNRYRLPLAITEVHVNGPRERQLTWIHKIWSSALKAREQGADVRAVTIWSLLGSYNWDSLCTRETGLYESGVFDVSVQKPRPTAIAHFIQTLSRNEQGHHELHEQFFRHPLLVTGGNGTLGKAFARICKERGLPVRTVTRADMDIADESSVRAALREIQPWAVINAAGYVRVDQAEEEPERCFRENVVGPENLARVCAERKIPLLTFSSDMVFDGSSQKAYLESSPVSPCNVYGRSKAEAEKRVLNQHPGALVVRTSSFFGPWDQANFVYHVLQSILSKTPFRVAQEITMSPTYVPDLVNACLDLLIDRETGIAHVTNDGALTWAELATLAVKNAASCLHFKEHSLDHSLIVPASLSELGYRAPRPKFSALASERFRPGSPVTHALERFFQVFNLPLGAKA